VCRALRGTIEDVFDATLVLSLALHVATFDFRGSAGVDDAIYAESLCMFASIATITLWHLRAEVSRMRMITRLTFYSMCLLDVAVCVMHHLPHNQPSSFFSSVCAVPGQAGKVWMEGNAVFVEIINLMLWFMCVGTTLLPVRSMFARVFPKMATKNGLRKWRCVQAVIGLCAMIGFMVLLASTRSAYVDGKSWGIGQYLAVATWVPALAKMGYLGMGT
jgi:hypothetical protein